MSTAELFAAVKAGDIPTIRDVLARGANINATVKGNKNTPLIVAIQSKNIDVVRLLLNSGADKEKPGNNDNTPLVVAINTHDSNIVKLLIESGAHVNKISKINTPLILAIKNRNKTIINMLLDARADVNIKDALDNSPLIIAINFFDNFDIIKRLLDLGADPNYKNPLFMIIEHIPLTKKTLDIIRLLIQKGADVNAYSEAALGNNNIPHGYTPLMLACYNNNIDLIYILLDAGARLEDKNDIGETALLYSLFIRKFMVAIKLINKGADINVQDNDTKSTPLIYAVHEGHLELINILLKKGADVNVTNIWEETALSIAASKNDSIVVSKILEKNPTITERIKRGIEYNEYSDRIMQLLNDHYGHSLGNIVSNAAANIVSNAAANIVSNLPNVNIPNNNAAANIRNASAFNFVEYGNVPIRELLENDDVLIVKYGPSYFTLYKSQVEADITSRTNIRFKCKRALQGAPHLVDIEHVPYFYIQGPGNFLVELAALKSAIARYKIIELIDTDIRFEHVASYSSVQKDHGIGLNGRAVNIVSADHCQAGTAQRIYAIKGLRLREENAAVLNAQRGANTRGGRRTKRRSGTKRRSTRRT